MTVMSHYGSPFIVEFQCLCCVYKGFVTVLYFSNVVQSSVDLEHSFSGLELKLFSDTPPKLYI